MYYFVICYLAIRFNHASYIVCLKPSPFFLVLFVLFSLPSFDSIFASLPHYAVYVLRFFLACFICYFISLFFIFVCYFEYRLFSITATTDFIFQLFEKFFFPLRSLFSFRFSCRYALLCYFIRSNI